MQRDDRDSFLLEKIPASMCDWHVSLKQNNVNKYGLGYDCNSPNWPSHRSTRKVVPASSHHSILSLGQSAAINTILLSDL